MCASFKSSNFKHAIYSVEVKKKEKTAKYSLNLLLNSQLYTNTLRRSYYLLEVF